MPRCPQHHCQRLRELEDCLAHSLQWCIQRAFALWACRSTSRIPGVRSRVGDRRTGTLRCSSDADRPEATCNRHRGRAESRTSRSFWRRPDSSPRVHRQRFRVHLRMLADRLLVSVLLLCCLLCSSLVLSCRVCRDACRDTCRDTFSDGAYIIAHIATERCTAILMFLILVKKQ